MEDRHAHLDKRGSGSLDTVAFGLHHEVVADVSVGPGRPKLLITPIFHDFFPIFSRFFRDFWLCSLDSWRPDAESGRKMGENG